jgi:hypothetical protein
LLTISAKTGARHQCKDNQTDLQEILQLAMILSGSRETSQGVAGTPAMQSV